MKCPLTAFGDGQGTFDQLLTNFSFQSSEPIDQTLFQTDLSVFGSNISPSAGPADRETVELAFGYLARIVVRRSFSWDSPDLVGDVN